MPELQRVYCTACKQTYFRADPRDVSCRLCEAHATLLVLNEGEPDPNEVVKALQSRAKAEEKRERVLNQKIATDRYFAHGLLKLAVMCVVLGILFGVIGVTKVEESWLRIGFIAGGVAALLVAAFLYWGASVFERAAEKKAEQEASAQPDIDERLP